MDKVRRAAGIAGAFIAGGMVVAGGYTVTHEDEPSVGASFTTTTVEPTTTTPKPTTTNPGPTTTVDPDSPWACAEVYGGDGCELPTATTTLPPCNPGARCLYTRTLPASALAQLADLLGEPPAAPAPPPGHRDDRLALGAHLALVPDGATRDDLAYTLGWTLDRLERAPQLRCHLNARQSPRA